MNRPSAHHHFAAPVVDPSKQIPSSHPPIWQDGPAEPVYDSIGSAILGFCSAVIMLLPAFALAIVILIGLDAVQESPPSDGSSLTTSSLILGLLGCSVLMGFVFAWLFSEPRVQGFIFDEQAQLLTLAITRRARRPKLLRVPFDDICYIRPYVVAAHDRCGHFSVVYRGPRNKVFEYQFAQGTSLAEMEFHAAWLRGLIGERMDELLNLDK